MDSFTSRWLLVLGIAAICFGIFLFVLRVPIRTIGIFFGLGIPVVLLWLYVDYKSKQQYNGNKISNSGNILGHQQPCVCSICKHEQAEICLNQKCACCLIMKDNKIIGHSIN
jgi:uncharacterized membrane protein